mgnify:CR=1 FL=1
MMMHGFGFPFFMGGPIFWLLIIFGGYLLLRTFLLPHLHSRSRTDGTPSHTNSRNHSNEFVETEIYRVAAAHNGTITVSEVVTELHIEPKKAERIMESMSDGTRVRMEPDENGVMLYTFPELQR